MLASIAVVAKAAGDEDGGSDGSMTCGQMKQIYKDLQCCGQPETETHLTVVPSPTNRIGGTNYCDGQKAITQPALDNSNCVQDAIISAGEQAGADITAGFEGTHASTITPIVDRFIRTALCPVNVHWHLGAEHRSEGQFDENGSAPPGLAEGHIGEPDNVAPPHVAAGGARRLSRKPLTENTDEAHSKARRLQYNEVRYGYACHHYTESDPKFTTEYNWQHCVDMHVGETYEVHWPHSAIGACGTPYQYQSPFYDGVFCGITPELLTTLAADPQSIANAVGVHGQVFTIVNDEAYYYPDLIRGMVVDDENQMGIDVGIYTGSTTGTSRDNTVCSNYSPITWQVDRKCHMISASSFDKMCADMKQQRDDMSSDLHPHGARQLVWQNYTAPNLASMPNTYDRTGAR